MSMGIFLWLLAALLAGNTIALIAIAWACRDVRDEGSGPWWD